MMRVAIELKGVAHTIYKKTHIKLALKKTTTKNKQQQKKYP